MCSARRRSWLTGAVRPRSARSASQTQNYRRAAAANSPRQHGNRQPRRCRSTPQPAASTQPFSSTGHPAQNSAGNNAVSGNFDLFSAVGDCGLSQTIAESTVTGTVDTTATSHNAALTTSTTSASATTGASCADLLQWRFFPFPSDSNSAKKILSRTANIFTRPVTCTSAPADGLSTPSMPRDQGPSA